MQLPNSMKQIQEAKYSLSPYLKQSLEILKFSTEELAEHIRKQAETNPFIELKEPILDNQIIDMASINLNERISLQYSEDASSSCINQLTRNNDTIETYLSEQLALQKQLSEKEKEIILYFVGNLNSRGYLECTLEEVAARFQLSLTRCEELLYVLQSFEPAGIGARDLAECLLLQVRRMKEAPPLIEVFIQYHLEDLAERKFHLLAKKYQICEEEIQQIFSFIQSLNPYPTIEFETVKTEYIVPDIILEEVNGEFVITLNDFYLPQVSINSYYEQLLRTNMEVKDYLKMKLSDAILLMNGISQRNETLYKVAKVIIQKQVDFLKQGKKALQPLTLKDVSDIVEIHESTVSRAVSNKYIQTPQGIFPLKLFFARGVKMPSGVVESAELIKQKIKYLIDQEDSKKPLSDQKVANALLAEGIHIARRTVAKYRKELGFLQSSKRKKGN